MNPEGIIKKFETIDGNMSKMKVVTVCLAAVMAVIILGALFMSYRYADSKSQLIYVIDQGKSLIALQTTDAATKDQEVTNHVRQFHQYFFNLAPNKEAQEYNFEKAYLLCDQSALKYHNDLQENNYYSRLISNNIIQYIEVDSVKAVTTVYPYKAMVFSTLKLQRLSSVTEYELVTSCSLVNIPRSENNTAGLMMENFAVVSQKQKSQLAR